MFVRGLVLRNCGHFLHVASDFGSVYRTHTFLTSEAMYAALSREVGREARIVDLTNDRYDFQSTYRMAAWPAWPTPGVFVASKQEPVWLQPPLTRNPNSCSSHDFNVVNEGWPSTGAGGRSRECPTYGSMETVLPDQRMVAYAFSPDPLLLKELDRGQVFMMGKKRSMFQLLHLSPVVQAMDREAGEVWWHQVSPTDIGRYREYEVLGATGRYLIIRGYCQDRILEAGVEGSRVAVPQAWLPFAQ